MILIASVFYRDILAMLVTIIGTALLVSFLQKQKKMRRKELSEGNVVNKQQQQQSSQLDSLTTCLVTLAGTFFVFCMPPACLSLVLYLNISNCFVYNAIRWGVCLGLLNSSTSFIVYYWKLPPFRKSVKRLVCSGVGNSSRNLSVSKVHTVSKELSSGKAI